MSDGTCCHYCNSYECICLQLEHGRVVKPHGYTSALWESMSDEARQAALIVDENWVVKFRDMRGVAALRTKERDAALAALEAARAEVERLKETNTVLRDESYKIDPLEFRAMKDALELRSRDVAILERANAALRSDLDAALADAAAMRLIAARCEAMLVAAIATYVDGEPYWIDLSKDDRESRIADELKELSRLHPSPGSALLERHREQVAGLQERIAALEAQLAEALTPNLFRVQGDERTCLASMLKAETCNDEIGERRMVTVRQLKDLGEATYLAGWSSHNEFVFEPASGEKGAPQ